MKISIIGYMGSGKSAVGKALSEITGYALLDLDSEIEKRANQTIAEIFVAQGEKYFRELEETALDSALDSREDLIIACGGGVILSEKNRKALSKKSTVVYLDGPLDLLYSRIMESGEARPLITGNDEERVFVEIFSRRRELYEKTAELTVNIEEKSPLEIAELIAREFKNRKLSIRNG